MLNGDLSKNGIADEGAKTVLLRENNPNPFNPSTTIPFDVPESAHVSLVIYDVTGRVVDRLVDGAISAGEHDVRYDAAHLPSGVYLYRLTTPNQVLSRTMHLVK